MNLATDPPITLGPAFMSREFHRATSLSGLLVGVFGAGAVAAAFTVAHRLTGSRVTLAVTLALTGSGAAVFALAPGLAAGLAGLFVMGVGYMCSNTAATSSLQLAVAPAHRGRIMVLWSLAFLGVRPLGSLVDGALASWAGLHVAALVMALPALTGAAVFALAGPRARPGTARPGWARR
jgi:MFS family permease